MTRTAIFVADPHIRSEQIEAIRRNLPAGWELADQPLGAVAMLTENVDVTADVAAAAGPSLKIVVRLDTGSARIAADLSALRITTVDLPNTALVGVAEHTLLLMMVLSRHLVDVLQRTQAMEWLPERSTPILTDQRKYTYNWIGLQDFGVLYRKTLGIVGLGLIGRAVAARARAFGMRVLYTQRRRLDPSIETQLGVTYSSLAGLLEQSDFVSLHHRFDDSPEGNDRHFGTEEFARMKSTAFLINTARGRLVDEDALIAALRSGQIAGAGLDVFRYEPLPPDHPFFALAGERLILTPHVAGAPIAEAWQTIAEELIEQVRAATAGGANKQA
jgi:phosphoglycerate dehydrogenase-like enzyme